MKRNILKHILNVGAGTIANAAIGLITTPVLTRIVDPSDYGKFAIFNTYAGIIVSFVYLGLDFSLVRFFYNDKDDEHKKSLLKMCVVVPSILAVIIFTIYYLLILIGVLDFRFSNFIFLLLFIYIEIKIFEKMSTSLLRLTYKTKEYALVNVVQKLVYFFTVIICSLVIKNYYTEILIIATCLSFVSSSLISIYFCKNYWNFKNVNLPSEKNDYFKYGIPLVVFAILMTLLDGIDNLFLDKYCSEYDVGLYSSAFTLISFITIIQTTFSMVWVPVQTEQYVTKPDDKSFIQKGNKYITMIMYFAGINLILFKDVLCYLLGQSYRESSVYMPFLILACIMYTISDSMCSGIEFSKKSYLNILAASIPCLISVIVLYLFTPKYGPKVAAMCRFAASAIYLIIRTFLSNKYYYIDYDLKKLFIITFISALFALYCTYNTIDIISVVIYLAIMVIYVLIYKKELYELLQLCKNFINKKHNDIQ